MKLNRDQPLEKATALGNDKLDRGAFAKSVVHALEHVDQEHGLVLSIEGKWGSGKTSTLAMVEELLESQQVKPLIVRFNPWLVGDRDALLGQFLTKVGKAAKLSEYAKDGKRVAKEIDAYAKAFEVVKLIPGAEPWASIVKSVLTSVGAATGAIAEHKTPDLEERKQKVHEALQKLSQPIIVFVDDVDRLFPKEVFEMVRIIKAVGDLPNVGYVLAWDAAYVEDALKSADVSFPGTYLDKIVQVRLSLPALSRPARNRLFDEAFEGLAEEAKKSHFAGDTDLLPELYESGLRQLLEQPRDIARLFNRVQLMEPKLRGNVVLADVIGLSALSLHARPVYDLLMADSKLFMPLDGYSVSEILDENKKDTLFGERILKRNAAIEQCHQSAAVAELVNFLFPVCAREKHDQLHKAYRDDDGRIASEMRLRVALQWGASAAEVNLINVQEFILKPDRRDALVGGLTTDNCLDFLDAISGMSSLANGMGSVEKEELLLGVARLLDHPLYATYTKNERWTFERTQLRFWRVIAETVNKIHKGHGDAVAEKIVSDPFALSMAATLLDQHWVDKDPSGRNSVMVSNAERTRLLEIYAKNVLTAVEQKSFWDLALPGRILKSVTYCESDLAQQLFTKLKGIDSKLDQFALEVFRAGFSSAGGDYYEMSETAHRVLYSKFCTLDELRSHAQARLVDPSLDFPARAAWMAVVSGKKVFSNGVDADL